MKTCLVWLHQDLRLSDNPALYHAAEAADTLIPVYIHAPQELEPWAPGAASRWWCHHSLSTLQQALHARGSRLIIRRGASQDVLQRLIRETGAGAVYWNHRYAPQAARRDAHIAAWLRAHDIEVHTYHGNLLYTPGSVLTKEHKPFRVFTPFWRACRQQGLGAPPLPVPQRLGECRLASEAVEALALLPDIPWHHGLASSWRPGEDNALEQLQGFCDAALAHYDAGRDRPDRLDTSRLSPHLAFGEISPRQVVSAVLNAFMDHATQGDSMDRFLSELGWREFAYHTLHHFPYATDTPLNPRFEAFPWRDDKALLRAWQQGKTGFPIIDAGMRQLWHSGWMHNRVRMIVASFLTKNGLQPWQTGARWFWDTLVDADLASNSFNWQWVAGCGLDAAPYFRIFNPVRQSERFDPHGDYLRQWLPELAQLPLPWLHRPWLTPADVQHACNVRIGRDYPAPILDLNSSRKRALNLSRQLPCVTNA
ncbi:deoxyribodipyrimidine photolyase [Candidatus Tenderia electrophaga]|jgi:deoxyribodipyrimidine photo-lyase|uniref:Deoxyribodipyrimidine photo-lyase n=1 Tax=Candidatus Tenderia electrophaga TaxID=1748243 RepID=A0A0S2TC83_9GAMM|nr:deoxyribodipyrimidine photolyase [Candidatus Tenderia electrophaga]